MQLASLIINRWIETAETKRLGRHIAEFWVIRDIVEGRLRVPPARQKQAIAFLKNHCRPSAERSVLLAAAKEQDDDGVGVAGVVIADHIEIRPVVKAGA